MPPSLALDTFRCLKTDVNKSVQGNVFITDLSKLKTATFPKIQLFKRYISSDFQNFQVFRAQLCSDVIFFYVITENQDSRAIVNPTSLAGLKE